MTDKIEVFKQNHIRIITNGKEIHFDPFQTEYASKSADYIFITHDHYDHFSVTDIERTAKKETTLIAPESMRGKAAAAEKYVGRIIYVKPGGSYGIDGVEFETVPAYNVLKPFHPKSAGWVGYILKAEGKRIYVAGDTDATKEAAEVKCDIALVPVGGTYTMDPEQAAKLVNTIKPKVAIPVHYGGIVGRKKDGLDFKNAVDKGIEVILKIK